MNSNLINKKLIPSHVIVVYKDKSEYSPKYYLERRELKNINGRYTALAPVPLEATLFKDIARAYVKENGGHSMGFEKLIPEHLLYCHHVIGNTVIAWYRPAMKRMLNFSEALGIKGESSVHVPATLYLLHNNKLYVYALMTSERPTLSTKLYNAPFFNIYTTGEVCLGTAPVGRVKSKTFEGEAERYERGFYMAQQNGGQSMDNCKTPLNKLWAELIKSKVDFPTKKELKQHKTFKTFSDLLQSFSKNK